MPSIRLDNYHGYNVQFSPFLPRFLACSASQHYGLQGQGALVIFENTNEYQLEIRKSFYWSDVLFDVAWAPSKENLLVTASGDGSLQLWLLFDDTTIRKDPIVCFKEHAMDVSTVDWNLNGIASGSWDCSLKIWKIEQPSSFLTFHSSHGVIHSVKWSPFSPIMLAVASQRGLILWDQNTNQQCSQSNPNLPQEFLDCDWSNFNDYHLATSGTDGEIKIWDTRKLIDPFETFMGHQKAVRKVKWSPHIPKVIASSSYDLSTIIWSFDSLSPVETVRHHSGFVYGLDFNKHVTGEMADCGWDSLIHVYVPVAFKNFNCQILAKNKL